MYSSQYTNQDIELLVGMTNFQSLFPKPAAEVW